MIKVSDGKCAWCGESYGVLHCGFVYGENMIEKMTICPQNTNVKKVRKKKEKKK